MGFKDLMKPSLENFDSKITQTIAHYLTTFPDEKDAAGLNAVKMKNDNETELNAPLFSKVIEIRKYYEKKNYLLKSIHKHFVSNEITKEKI
ncbi:MAG: hypothetical protein WA705_05135 [Candidatus Ozemobacteraceae bacterium]